MLGKNFLCQRVNWAWPLILGDLLTRLALGWHQGNWILGGFPALIKVAHCADCLCKQCGLCWTPALLLGVWNFGRCLAEAAWVTSSRGKLWHWVWTSFLGRQHFPCAVSTLLGLSSSCVTPLEENSSELLPISRFHPSSLSLCGLGFVSLRCGKL